MIAGATLAAVTISGCGGKVPTQEEIRQDNIDSRAAQLVRVGDTTREAGDLANAMQLYRRAADMRADWALPFYRFGETALSAGLYEEALAAYDRAAEIEPQNNRGYNGAGIALDLLGRHGEAQSRYVTGMEHTPDSVPLRNNLGLSLALAGDLEEAVSWLEAVADRDLDGLVTGVEAADGEVAVEAGVDLTKTRQDAAARVAAANPQAADGIHGHLQELRGAQGEPAARRNGHRSFGDRLLMVADDEDMPDAQVEAVGRQIFGVPRFGAEGACVHGGEEVRVAPNCHAAAMPGRSLEMQGWSRAVLHGPVG